ncbi:hypothetical protein [Stenotrophomonas sp. NPDC077659]|uniref:hypothetical protein n=1 Tax=Stenotrophomonas sp. NPDC077659 TaxID=3390694 RepID=UPI003D01DDCF
MLRENDDPQVIVDAGLDSGTSFMSASFKLPAALEDRDDGVLATSWKRSAASAISYFAKSGARYTTGEDSTERLQAVLGALRASEASVRVSHKSFSATAVSIQAWEGVVEDVLEDERKVYVKLIDKTDRSAGDSFAYVPLDQFDPEDADLIVPGAIFYWYVGYETKPSGRTRSSMIRFRRVPAWTANDLKRTEAEADELFKSLRFERA